MPRRGRLSFLLRLGSGAVAGVAMIACSGCTTPPDARCLSSRPAWSSIDAQSIRAKQTAAAKEWDRQCTLVGVIGSADAGW
jgi:hypothetical protein